MFKVRITEPPGAKNVTLVLVKRFVKAFFQIALSHFFYRRRWQRENRFQILQISGGYHRDFAYQGINGF
jgi:hypothetical protein